MWKKYFSGLFPAVLTLAHKRRVDCTFKTKCFLLEHSCVCCLYSNRVFPPACVTQSHFPFLLPTSSWKHQSGWQHCSLNLNCMTHYVQRSSPFPVQCCGIETTDNLAAVWPYVRRCFCVVAGAMVIWIYVVTIIHLGVNALRVMAFSAVWKHIWVQPLIGQRFKSD